MYSTHRLYITILSVFLTQATCASTQRHENAIFSMEDISTATPRYTINDNKQYSPHDIPGIERNLRLSYANELLLLTITAMEQPGKSHFSQSGRAAVCSQLASSMIFGLDGLRASTNESDQSTWGADLRRAQDNANLSKAIQSSHWHRDLCKCVDMTTFDSNNDVASDLTLIMPYYYFSQFHHSATTMPHAAGGFLLDLRATEIMTAMETMGWSLRFYLLLESDKKKAVVRQYLADLRSRLNSMYEQFLAHSKTIRDDNLRHDAETLVVDMRAKVDSAMRIVE